MILQVPVPGGPELIVLLLVLVFNLAIVALVVAGGVFLYRRLRGDGPAEQSELDALRSRVAELEARVESEGDGRVEAESGGVESEGEAGDAGDDR